LRHYNVHLYFSLIIRSSGIKIRGPAIHPTFSISVGAISRQHYSSLLEQRVSGQLGFRTSGTAAGTMANPSGSGGTSLAPTPTHAHRLSRETSGNELEIAESLRRLNQTHDNQMSRTQNTAHGQPSPLQGDEPPEIYHSLEDAVPISEGTATPAGSASLPPNLSNFRENSAPMSGQICRYVV
jgi:hypothetical protein